MLRKLGLALAALSLVFFSVFAVSGPASASTHYGCQDNWVCLYQWLNLSAPPGDANPGWRSSFTNLRNQLCINLNEPAAYWPNGTKVWDNSAGLIVNGNGAYSNADSISFYNGLNCNSSTGITSYNANWYQAEPDLRNVPMGYMGNNAYHTIASIGWNEQCIPPPPPGSC